VSAMKNDEAFIQDASWLASGRILRHVHYGSGQAISSIAEKPGASHCS
jgi:hypothetical protein